MDDSDKKLVGMNALVVLGQVLYTLSPIDLIPDFIPILGQMDDLLAFCVTVAFTTYTVWQLRKNHLLEDKVEPAADRLDETTLDAAYSRQSDVWQGYEPLDPGEIAAL